MLGFNGAFETGLFVVRHGEQSLIKWMPVNFAVWGPRGTEYHVLPRAFRQPEP